MTRWSVWILVSWVLSVGCVSEADLYQQTGYDLWYQAPSNDIDILWVVDDSCSMAEEQDLLSSGFATFIGEMESTGTDFQIGVITTSFEYSNSDRGVLLGEPAFITPEDDYVGLFAERAVVGIHGADKEKGLEAAAYAVSPVLATGANMGFVRPEARLLVVFVTDEEDCSDGGALEGFPAEACYTRSDELVPVSEYVVAIRNLKEDPNLIQLSAIIGLDDSSCADVYPGDRYEEAATLTGGLVGDVCDSDWSSMMGDLGLTASGIRSSFRLTNAAVPDTLQVFVNDVEVFEDSFLGWTYNPDTWFIDFHGPGVPERSSEIYATYTVLPGATPPSDILEAAAD